MAAVASDVVCMRKCNIFKSKWHATASKDNPHTIRGQARVRASSSMEDKNKLYKRVAGWFSVKKKIEDAVQRAELLAPTALEIEKVRWIKQDEIIRASNLWEDLAKSNDILVDFAGSAKVVDALKDLTYKAEEAKLITQLAETDAVNCRLFIEAYDASLDVSKFLDHYEMAKLLKEPLDAEGACITIKAGPEDAYSKIWAKQLVRMYIKWAKKRGYKGRIVDKFYSKNGGIELATIDFESEYAYGYLSGERGVHYLMRSSQDGSFPHQVCLAGVDVIPLFLGTTPSLHINDEDLNVCSSLTLGEGKRQHGASLCIHHIPTGISVHSSGERSHFANKMKALNRLTAKLHVVALEQGVSAVTNITKDAINSLWQIETRTYISHPCKLVHDMKTGMELADLDSVLEGNIGALIGAHVSTRKSCHKI